MFRKIIFGLLMLCLILPALAQSGYEPIFEETDCLFELQDITCGLLITPEDRANPDGNQVELAVVIIHSRAANPAPEAVVYLEGGPGGWALLNTEDLQKLPILDTHTLIVYDQRGTGLSYPSLNCPEVEQGDSAEACRDRLLEEGVNLDMYNSAASAADINDLRIALGYDQFVLYGISYGTRLALTVIRDYPEAVHSAIIDSVYPSEIDDLSLTAVAYPEALAALFERCAADPDCDESFPNLETVFFDTVTAFDESPVVLETEEEELELSGDELLAQMFLALYDSQRIPYLPYAIYLIANAESDEELLDGYSLITGALVIRDEGEAPESAILESPDIQEYIEEMGEIEDSEGMNLSVDCSEEYLLNDVDAAYAAAESAPPAMQNYFLSSIESNLEGCQSWGVQPADSLESQRVQSDHPVLIVSGLFDPITPPSSGDSALLGLPNGQHIVFPTAGHGITFTDNPAGECAKQLVVDFLDDPFAQVDTACVEETDILDFYLGD